MLKVRKRRPDFQITESLIGAVGEVGSFPQKVIFFHLFKEMPQCDLKLPIIVYARINFLFIH